MRKNDKFSFEISLSVLNHLGRNLYRSFITVLGEAISNAWDADARNVWIYIDRKQSTLVIKDDGIGMTKDDFQNKFLRIGYSKRRNGEATSPKGRPFIGRKGIGKLALLSCAKKITVVSKTKRGDYIGGLIDNSGLDQAITDDLTPQQYPLGEWEPKTFKRFIVNHKHGTVIHFDKINDGIRNSVDYLKKTIALYFRFSLLDNSFNLFLNDERITVDCLNELAEKTQFLWSINDQKDPYVDKLIRKVKEKRALKVRRNIQGFIGSVEVPRDLKIITTEEKLGVDLFVNGRLREKDILKNIPTARVVESYLYGQIHFNELDDKVDRFTSNREGIVADDVKHKELLDKLKKVMGIILKDWDIWRRKHKKDGDPENTSIPIKERKSEELYRAVSDEYTLPKTSKRRKQVDGWVDDLGDDARFNFVSYAECFISENLIRKYIQEIGIPISIEAKTESDRLKQNETVSKGKGNLSIEIRKLKTDLGYLSMEYLAALVDKAKDRNKEACLLRDANEYKPIRDALAHTALLTDVAKHKLTSVYENIKGRVRTLLADNKKRDPKKTS